MRKGYGKRLLACFLALTLFLTSGLLILFRNTVFGAANKNNNTQPYYDESTAQSSVVGLRGKDGTMMYMLTDEGSNLKGKVPSTSYLGWTSESTGVRVPATMGEKGSAGNPFVVLEVVPDKSMQELTYFAGPGEDTGLPYEEGHMSASLMEKLRKSGGNNYKNLHFTNQAWTKENINKDENAKNGYKNFTKSLANKVSEIYGTFLGSSMYNIFKPSTSGHENDPDSYENLIDVYDSKSDENKVGKYKFNEIYNIRITTDDLLQILPTTQLRVWGKEINPDTKKEEDPKEPSKAVRDAAKADHPFVFYEKSTGQTNEYYEREFTDDMIYFVAAQKGFDMTTENGIVHLRKGGKEITTKDIQDYIQNELCGVVLNGNRVKNNKNSAVTYHATELIKYNLKEFSPREALAEGIGQNITFTDYQNAKAFDEYDISQSLVYRGDTSETRMLFEDGDDLVERNGNYKNVQNDSWTMPISNYWKVQFRKKYIDTFTQYYKEFKEADDAFKQKEGTDNPWGNPMDNDTERLYKDRNDKLEKLLKTYAPFFESKGVSIKTMYDPGNWETNAKTTLSEVRKYETVKSGGYILAVKPGKGDMYLLKDKEIYDTLGYDYNENTKAVTKKSSLSNDPFFDDNKIELGIYDKEDSESVKIQKVKDYVKKCFVFTRDDKDSNVEGSSKRPESERRWLYVPSQFGLEGDMPKGSKAAYHNGYLDDSNYTFGFASKSIRNKDDMKMAIYDRYNRRHHGINESGGANNRRDIKTFQRVDQNGYSKTIEAFSKKMLYFTNDESTANISDANSGSILYNTFQRGDGNGRKKTDSYHLNVWNEISKSTEDGGLGIEGDSQEQRNIDEHDNLINGDGQSWRGNLGSNWLYDYRGDNILTGLCFNFKDIAISTDTEANNPSNVDSVIVPHVNGSHPYLQVSPDIYNKYVISGGTQRRQDNTNFNGYDYYSNVYKHPIFLQRLSDTRREVEEKRFVNDDEVFQVGGQFENKNGKEVYTIDKDVVARETVTNFNFTYYGFKTNPILKESLFTFDTQDEMRNFHVKVVCVTPAELNQIAAEAKKWNGEYPNAITPNNECYTAEYKAAYMESEAQKSDKKKTKEELASDEWKKTSHKGNIVNSNLRLDLIDRADMFYIHSMIATRNSNANATKVDSDQIGLAMQFYKEIVLEGKGPDWNVNSLDSFFENDLEWDQAMKIIKKSSMPTGINIPIMFNQIVSQMPELAIDANDSNKYNNAEDTHQALYGNTMQKYAGNINNISKLYNILLQFDLHAVKKKTINYEETDPNKQRKIKRSFMQDIYPYLKEADIMSTYTKPQDKDRVAYSAKKTGYVDAYTGDPKKYKNPGSKFERVLCLGNDSSEAFKRNTLGLWNRFTFYPYSVDLTGDYKKNGSIDTNLLLSFQEQGYLESYFRSFKNMSQGEHNMFDKNMNTVDQSWRYRLGTDGTDYQNVYVLHWFNNPDNRNGNSFLCNVGETEKINGDDYPVNKASNDFLTVAHRIMNYRGEPEPVEINARARNKVYTLLGRTGKNTDSIMLDYYNNRSMYTADKLAELEGQEKNVKHSIFNPNTDDEPALITGVYLRNSSNENAEKNNINILSELFDDKNEGKISLATVSQTSGSTQIKQGEKSSRGLLVKGGKTEYCYVPYKLEDFFDGYDEIVFQGLYWKYNVREKTYSTEPIEHTTMIIPRDLFNLE